MFALRKRLTTFLCSTFNIVAECRYASVSNSVYESKYLQKIINKNINKGKGAKTKKKWHQTHSADPLEVFSLKEPRNKQGESRTESIRARQLGHVLYDKIVQIINTGELSEELLTKQVFITSVKMLNNFQGVHIYWDNNRSDAEEVETLLQAHAGKLRSMLISYHVLGRIPVITFVKDRLHTELTRLNQLFELADYGPDYVPSFQNSILRDQLLAQWGRPAASQLIDPSATKMSNTTDASKMSSTTDAGFDTSDATPELETEGSAAPDVVQNDSELSDSDTVESSESDTQTVSPVSGLAFMSNVYQLPHDDLMRKVIGQKGNRLSDGLVSNKEATVEFNAKRLKSRKDKIRLDYVASSSKFKQKLLERSLEDFMNEKDDG